MQTSANWAELLEPTLYDIFDFYGPAKKLPDMIGKLFNHRKANKATMTVLQRGSIGMMSKWSESNNQVSYDTVSKGWKTEFAMEKYSNGLKIERELWDDDQFDEIQGLTEELAFSVYYTRQYQAASVFNNAFNAGYAGADSAALCANSHTLVPSGSVTIDNLDTLELNAANVETVRNRMKLWTDDRGNIIPMNPDTLLVPPGKRKAALVIADSDKEPDVADNNVNVWKGALNVIEWEMLTSTTAWFMLDSARTKRDLFWWDKRVPKLERDGDNFDTEVAKWKTVGRWQYGWRSPLFVYGLNATT